MDPDHARAFREERSRSGLAPVVVHTTYLVNLASSDQQLRRKSIESIGDDLIRAESLGAEFVVTHLGSVGVGDRQEGLERVARALVEITSEAPPGPILLLENSAGGGGTVGSRLEDLAFLLGHNPQAGLCLDVCHLHVSGEDLSATGSLSRLVEQLSSLIGLDRLKVVHANDCRYPSGSHADRHEHIGEGTLGLEFFRDLVNHPALADLTCILETPTMDLELDLRNIRLIRSLIEAPPPDSDESENPRGRD